jgi:hypothetical protein
MRYQLVLQFEANTTDDFDQLVVLEDKLIEEGPADETVEQTISDLHSSKTAKKRVRI